MTCLRCGDRGFWVEPVIAGDMRADIKVWCECQAGRWEQHWHWEMENGRTSDIRFTHPSFQAAPRVVPEVLPAVPRWKVWMWRLATGALVAFTVWAVLNR